MKSQEEEFCKYQYDEYLLKKDPQIIREWYDVPQSEEPPDYFLVRNGIKYAVEVTSLVEYIDAEKSPLTTIGLNQFWIKLVQSIENEAKKRKILSGAYTVKVSGSIDNFKALRNEVVNKILNYIEDTQSLEQAQDIIIYKYCLQSIKINKSHNQRNAVYVGLPARAKWGGQVELEIRELIEKAVSSKTYKLRNITLPKILILLDYYLFADRDHYIDCKPNLSGSSFFEEIFIVTTFRENFILHEGSIYSISTKENI